MDKTQFIEDCFNRGICRKQRAVKYTESKPRDYEYTEKDIQEVYSFDDIITNGDRMWANYVSPNPECYNEPSYYGTRESHTPIRKRKMINGKLLIVEE